MKKERKTTLLDRTVIRHGEQLRPAVEAAWQQRHYAKRYVFDKAASTRVGEFMRDCVDLMVDNIEFARPPFNTAYFEIDTMAMWQGWRPEQIDKKKNEVGVDQTVGFLIHNGVVVVLAGGAMFRTTPYGLVEVDSGERANVCGISFRINRPQTIPYAKLTDLPEEYAEQAKAAYVFGGQRTFGPQHFHYTTNASGKLVKYADPTVFGEGVTVSLPDLPGAWTHNQVAAHFDILPAFMQTSTKEMLKLSFLGGGDPMLLTTALLLMNQPSKHVGLVHTPRERSIYKGKLKTWHEFHTVTFHLDPKHHVRRMLSVTDRASPIGHTVPGHWRNFNKADHCNHHHEDGRQAWEPVGAERCTDGNFKRYWCPLCLQRRTRIEAFERGDAARGHTSTDYLVQP